jgi:hypothetical protein
MLLRWLLGADWFDMGFSKTLVSHHACELTKHPEASQRTKTLAWTWGWHSDSSCLTEDCVVQPGEGENALETSYGLPPSTSGAIGLWQLSITV